MEYGDKEEKSRCVRRILSGVELDSIVMVDTGIAKDYEENLSTDSQQGWACFSFDNVYILHTPGQFVYVYNKLVYIFILTFVLTHVCA